MVSRNKQNESCLLCSFVDGANCFVGFGDSGDGGIIYASVPDLVGVMRCGRNEDLTTNHIRRRKIAHDEFMLALLKDLDNLLSDTVNTHLRVFVVRGNLGRGNHVSLFVFELLLNATVEEKRYMCVLLSF